MPKHSSVGDLIQDHMRDNITSMNNPTCENCSECCSMITMLTPEEFNGLKRFVKKDKRGKFLYDRGLDLFMKYLAEGTIYWMCPFMWNNRCSIYNRRPIICREFHCDNPEHSKNVRDLYDPKSKTIADIFGIKEFLNALKNEKRRS